MDAVSREVSHVSAKPEITPNEIQNTKLQSKVLVRSTQFTYHKKRGAQEREDFCSNMNILESYNQKFYPKPSKITNHF